jgi:Protein of unknown function (DUF3352)
MKASAVHYRARLIQLSSLIVAVGVTAFAVGANPPAGPTQPSPSAIHTPVPAPDAADYLPADTLAVARIGNLAQFKKSWRNSSFGAQVDDPALRKFFLGVAGKLSRITDGLGVSVTDLWQLVDGEFSLAAIKNQEGQLTVVAIADLGNEAAARALVQRLEKQLLAEGADLTRLELGSTQLRSWRRGGHRNLANVSFFIQGGRLVFGEDLQTLAETARRAQEGSRGNDSPPRPPAGGEGRGEGGHDRLSRNENFQHVMSRIAPGGDRSGFNWYVNPTAVVHTAMTANLGGASPPAELQQMLDAFGLDQVRGVGGTVWLGQGGMDSVSTTYGYLPTPVSGALKALTLPATVQRPPAWVKEDVSLYAQINWSVARFVETLRQVVDRSRGPGAFDQALGSLAVGADGTTLAQVAQTIDGPLHIASEIPQNASELLRQKTVFGFGIRDPKLLRGLLRQAAKTRNTSTELIGSADTIPGGIGSGNQQHPLSPQRGERAGVRGENAEMFRFRVNLSEALPGADLPPMELGILVTDQAVLFSPNADYLAATFGQDRSHVRPLADSPEYRRIASQFPERTSMISFERQDGRLEGLYEQLRSGLLNVGGIPGAAANPFDFDFKTLPPFTTMSRYLQTTGSFIVPEKDGFRIVNLALPPHEQ